MGESMNIQIKSPTVVLRLIVLCETKRNEMVLCETVLCETVLCEMVLCEMVLCETVLCEMVRCETVLCENFPFYILKKVGHPEKENRVIDAWHEIQYYLPRAITVMCKRNILNYL